MEVIEVLLGKVAKRIGPLIDDLENCLVSQRSQDRRMRSRRGSSVKHALSVVSGISTKHFVYVLGERQLQ